MGRPALNFRQFTAARDAKFPAHKIAKPVTTRSVGAVDTPQATCGVRRDMQDHMEQVSHLRVGIDVRAPLPANDFGH